MKTKTELILAYHESKNRYDYLQAGRIKAELLDRFFVKDEELKKRPKPSHSILDFLKDILK